MLKMSINNEPIVICQSTFYIYFLKIHTTFGGSFRRNILAAQHSLFKTASAELVSLQVK